MKKDNNIELDYPFYKDVKINILDVLILTIVPILFTIYTFFPFEIPFGLSPYLFTFLQLGAFLIVAKGKISLLIKKPNKRDILRVFVTLILQFVIAISLALILKYLFHIATNENGVFELEMNVRFWIVIIVQLFGEELYKILLFLAALIVSYKLTKKRTLSIGIALTFSLTCFAFLHATTYNNVIQILLLQGAASLCCMYNYLKTKNILTSYMQHLLFDAIPFILSMLSILN